MNSPSNKVLKIDVKDYDDCIVESEHYHKGKLLVFYSGDRIIEKLLSGMKMNLQEAEEYYAQVVDGILKAGTLEKDRNPIFIRQVKTPS